MALIIIPLLSTENQEGATIPYVGQFGLPGFPLRCIDCPMKTFVIVGLLVLALNASAGEKDRFVKFFAVSTNQCVVVAEGDLEWRSVGSYSIRLSELVDDRDLPAGEFYSGVVRERAGTIENVILKDLDGDGSKDVIVTIRCAGTGNYLSADAFSIHDKKLTLIASVQMLDPKVDCLNALKKQLSRKK